KIFLFSKGIRVDYSPVAMSVALILFVLPQKLPDPFWVISTCSFMNYLPLLKVINEYWKIKEAGVTLDKSNYR
ncbi:hypothetical protein, partial [Leptospira fletcheri]|uniref:hypothetical protein n=1 Tax=Leptospira fletcheri TaxID=2484981 RepID=UPI001AEFFBB0